MKSVEGLATRPTTDRVKESVFNMVQHDLYQAKCLDLFAGSGALGIEFLSRGAASCIFVDSGKDARACIQLNLEKTKLLDRARIIQKDVCQTLKDLSGNKFDFIIMDPPYFNGEIKKTLKAIEENDLLTKSGSIVVEFGSGDEEVENIPPCYEIVKNKTYGKISILILRRSHEDSGISGEF